jgi:hypothetical protein
MHKLHVEGQIFNKPGRALNLSGYLHIVIDNCKFENTGGIFIQAMPNSTIHITNNQATNIIKSGGMDYAQFVQISGLNGSTPENVVVSCSISGNVITNLPGHCDVEDNINLISVSGTKESPIMVTDNTINGGYPIDMSPASLKNYSGGGIICDRGTNWVVIKGNKVYETTNYGIGIAGGSNNLVTENTAIAKNALNVGIYSANMYKGDPFENNVVNNNVVSWMTPNGPNNYWFGK